MNKLSGLLVGLLLSLSFGMPVVPVGMVTVPFQGLVCPDSVSGYLSTQFKLASSTGNVIWTETKSVTINGGEVSTLLGDTSALPLDLPLAGLQLLIQVGSYPVDTTSVLPTMGAIKALKADAVLGMVTSINVNSPTQNVVSEKAVVTYVSNCITSMQITNSTVFTGPGTPSNTFPAAKIGDIYVETASPYDAFIRVGNSTWRRFT